MSISHERRIVAYLKPKNKVFIKAFADTNEMAISECINVIIKDYVQRLPREDRDRYFQVQDKKIFL